MSNPRGAQSQESNVLSGGLNSRRRATDLPGEQGPEGGSVQASRFFGSGVRGGERQEGSGRRETVRIRAREKL